MVSRFCGCRDRVSSWNPVKYWMVETSRIMGLKPPPMGAAYDSFGHVLSIIMKQDMKRAPESIPCLRCFERFASVDTIARFFNVGRPPTVRNSSDLSFLSLEEALVPGVALLCQKKGTHPCQWKGVSRRCVSV
jgi:hypothetical protein